LLTYVFINTRMYNMIYQYFPSKPARLKRMLQNGDFFKFCLPKIKYTYLALFYYHIVVVLSVHCHIYKSSYNISWLNSTSLSFSFISPSHHSWNSFNTSNFSIFTHKYIIVLLSTKLIINKDKIIMI
jgi:hypothetical protein